jgi:hypothetical protein
MFPVFLSLFLLGSYLPRLVSFCSKETKAIADCAKGPVVQRDKAGVLREMTRREMAIRGWPQRRLFLATTRELRTGATRAEWATSF